MSFQQISVALTGGIGTGKSTVCRMLRRLKVPVFSSDEAVHEILMTHQDIIHQIQEHFPKTVIKGGIDQFLLGKEVFEKEKELFWLEKLIHPRVEKMRKSYFQAQRGGKIPFFVSEIPLLFEINLDKEYDKIGVVTCSENSQKQRVLKRKGMTEAKYKAILKRQLSSSERAIRADYVIPTDGTKRETFQQLRKVLQNC